VIGGPGWYPISCYRCEDEGAVWACRVHDGVLGWATLRCDCPASGLVQGGWLRWDEARDAQNVPAFTSEELFTLRESVFFNADEGKVEFPLNEPVEIGYRGNRPMWLKQQKVAGRPKGKGR